MVVAGFLAYRGWKEKFRSKLDFEGNTGKDGKAYVLFGKVGYIAKGVAFAVVGLLFLYAAVTHDSSKSGGLDQALHKLLDSRSARSVLVVIAIGFAGYGLFCFAWARHLDRRDADAGFEPTGSWCAAGGSPTPPRSSTSTGGGRWPAGWAPSRRPWRPSTRRRPASPGGPS